MIMTAKKLEKPTATKGEAGAVYSSLADLITANDRRVAVASTLALLLLDGSVWLGQMRKDGMFRASRYGYNSACVKKVVAASLEFVQSVNLPPERIRYLESVLALLGLAEAARQIHCSIVQRLKVRHKSALKTLLAIVNSSFAADWVGNSELDENSVLHWSGTELASAFSRLYMIFRKELGIDVQSWIWTDDLASSMHEGVYSSLLVDAAKLNELIDAEVLLDGLPYKAEITPSGVLVSAINADFERSVRLGYIQTDLQLVIRAVSSLRNLGGDEPKLPSFKVELSKLFGIGLLDFVSLKRHPKERMVLKLPQIPQLIDLLNLDAPFLEEFPLLQGAHIDYFQPPQNGLLQVSEKLSVMDLLKAQRLFNLVDTVFREKLSTVDDPTKRRVLTLRSTVMVVAHADLLQMLEFVMSSEKAQELISLLSLITASSATGSDEYIDLQYKPFVRLLNSENEYIAIPPAIVGKSNLVRSVMHISKIKNATAAADDPMQIAIASALREAGFLVQESFEFNISGKRETDIFCYRDRALFVIECKNAYHPCSPHELRNSYDLILKAEEQLDIRAKWLEDLGNQAKLFEAMGWNVAPTALVWTCVVTANRCFNGYQNGAHPVRQAHELISVLTRGYVGRGPGEQDRRFWRANAFEIADLIDYLGGKSVIQTQHAAMAPVTRSVDFRGRKLELARFVMDLEDAGRLIDDTFEPIPRSGGSEDAAAGEATTPIVPA